MSDYLYLGPTPYDEKCEQQGPNYDPIQARKECRVLIEQLRRMFGPEPEGARLQSVSFNNGEYREVVCYYDPDNNASVEYAYRCEREFPQYWDKEAKEKL